MRVWVLAAIAAAPFISFGAAAQSSCGVYDFATPFAAAFAAGETFGGAVQAAETITTIADGACHQDKLIGYLGQSHGAVAGYKAAATSQGTQKQLGLDGPVLGVLFGDMLIDHGATYAIDDAARLIFELDLLVRVSDPALIDATTRAQALAGIDAVIPFIELGDLMVPKGAAITGPLLQAMNAGARAGVVGEPIALSGMGEDVLAAGTGVLTKDGSVVAEAPATALLGHPLDAVLWIVDAAKARGFPLNAGDVLSLGGLGRFQLAAPGEVTASYTFGDQEAAVSVILE